MGLSTIVQPVTRDPGSSGACHLFSVAARPGLPQKRLGGCVDRYRSFVLHRYLFRVNSALRVEESGRGLWLWSAREFFSSAADFHHGQGVALGRR